MLMRAGACVQVYTCTYTHAFVCVVCMYAPGNSLYRQDFALYKLIITMCVLCAYVVCVCVVCMCVCKYIYICVRECVDTPVLLVVSFLFWQLVLLLC